MEKKFTAFISYNSRDDKWAKWLQKRLENYSLPTVIANDEGKVLKSYDKKPEKFKIFRYISDLVAKTLTEGLSEELERSQHLIVICSPNSAKSKWCGKEMQYFIDHGMKDKIIPFIVAGTPYSNDENECFNPVLKAAFGEGELLGVNVHDEGDDLKIFRKRKAVAKVVSLLIGLPDAYGFIWNRYQHRLYNLWIFRILAALAVVAAIALTWWMNRDFNCNVQAKELTVENTNLPPMKDAVITLQLDNETKTDTLRSIGEKLTLPNIPHRYLGKKVHLKFEAANYLPLDTVVELSKEQTIGVKRDEKVFGTINFTLWNESREVAVPNAEITVGDQKTRSDGKGMVRLTIPLEKQRMVYDLSSPLKLLDTQIAVPHTESTIIGVE